jgi:hypothetical protein
MSESHTEHGITPPGGPAGHGVTLPGGPGGAPLHFSDQEWQQFRGSDLAAARAVVLLMASIFTTGLILYSTIDLLIW